LIVRRNEMPSQGGTLTFRQGARYASHGNPRTDPDPFLSRPSLADRLLASVRSWLTRRAVLEELHGLDDRTLADLRISLPGSKIVPFAADLMHERGALSIAPGTIWHRMNKGAGFIHDISGDAGDPVDLRPTVTKIL
jgi:uncharacterized protein YjiS (DUF1127 family)